MARGHLAQRTVHFRPTQEHSFAQRGNLRCSGLEGFDGRDGLFHFGIHRGTESGPGCLLLLTDFFLGLLTDGVELLLSRCTFEHEELAKLSNAIVFGGPRHALFGLIAFVRARGAVALRLGDFFHVDEHRHMFLSAALGGSFVGRNCEG